MEEYLHNFKGIAKGRDLPPRNPMEYGNSGIKLTAPAPQMVQLEMIDQSEHLG
jgi:hypothetical protein